MSVGLLISTISCIDQNQSFLTKECIVFAHRGASGYELENTLPAFQKAVELKAEAVELDVFKCKSGEIVVFHDEELDRLSDHNGKVEEFTASELQSLSLKNGNKIPLLKDVLELLMVEDILINIELKGLHTSQGVNDVLFSIGMDEESIQKKVIISSFEWDELERMRTLNSKIPIAVLTAEDPLKAIDFARKVNALAINPNAADISLTNVQAIHNSGLKVFAWTVNEEGLFKNLIYAGVDGIFSDYPDKAFSWLNEILTTSTK